jgi:hypothetical protein
LGHYGLQRHLMETPSDPHRHHRSRLRGHRPDAPVGSVAYEVDTNEQGERAVWLEEVWADKLTAMRGPGESYSDVTMRIAGRDGARNDPT